MEVFEDSRTLKLKPCDPIFKNYQATSSCSLINTFMNHRKKALNDIFSLAFPFFIIIPKLQKQITLFVTLPFLIFRGIR